jgi:hypothetical protein
MAELMAGRGKTVKNQGNPAQMAIPPQAAYGVPIHPLGSGFISGANPRTPWEGRP